MSVLTDNWDEFIGWAKRFYSWSEFDDQLRQHKLNVVAHALRKARDAVRRNQGNWALLLRLACQAGGSDHPKKDLPDSNYYGPFVRWCEADPARARSVLLAVWDEHRDPVERVREFMVTMTAVRERLNEKKVYNNMFGMQASFLLLGEDPYRLPMYRDDPFNLAYKLITGSGRERSHPGDSGKVYQLALCFLDQFIREASARGVELRDRLDAQSLVWCVTTWREQIADLTPQEYALLLAYRDSWRNRKGDSTEITAIRLVVAEQAGEKAIPPRAVHNQGYLQSKEARQELERYAMQRATEWYKVHGWQVCNVSALYSYDLHCTKEDGTELRVEVKGTTSEGNEVLLTPNEVRHAREYYPHTALFVVAELKFDGNDETGYLASGGKLFRIQPWKPDDDALEPVGYVYAVPTNTSR